MDSNFSLNKNHNNLTSPIVEDVSPNDIDYPVVLFTNGLKNRIADAQIVARKIYRAVEKQAPIFVQAKQALKKGCRYIVDISEQTMNDIDAGKIKLTSENGRLYAQLRSGNHYSKKLPIRRESFRQGFDATQIVNALQMQALQEQLQTITEQINVISYNVKDVLQGQQNDRIGLYYSGLSLFLEAKNIVNIEMKQALIAHSLTILSEAIFQLTITMQSEINYLARKEYKMDKKNSKALINQHMQKINQCFAFIHQATMLRAGIYCNQDELAAMSTVLDEYSNFIKGTVVNNINLLSSCDESDDGTDRGIWKSRANLKLDVSDIARKLNTSNKTMYLGIMEDND